MNVEKIRKIIRKADNLIDKFITIVFILFFMIGVYGMVDSYSIYADAQNKGALKYKPESGEVLSGDLKNNIAWLTLDESTIDYPVMQGQTNHDYISTDPYGNYTLSGSIFLDFRNKSDFSDKYNLVYGHHMENHQMFGELDRWLDKSFFDSHKTGTFTTTNAIYKLQVYAILEKPASTSELFQPTDVSSDNSIAYIQENAMYLDESVTPEHVLALSTCKYPDTDDRTLLICNMELIYQGKDTELDQRKTTELAENQKQIGGKIYSNVKPKTPNPTALDSFLKLIGIE